MPAASFPASVAAEYEHGTEVLEFPVSVSAGEEAAKAGELMYYDTGTATMKRCGADPSLIAGICEGASNTWRLLTADNKVPLRCLKPNALVRMGSSTAPLAAHEGVLYGIVRDANGHWIVDISDTSNTRVLVVKAVPATGEFFVKFIAANLQFDAIAS